MTKRWQTALVTGASSGIGDAIARQLAAQGTDLVVVARTTEKLKTLESELGVDVEVLPADLTNDDDLAAVEARLRSADQPIELLVNNAGYGIHGDFADVPIADQEHMVRLNVLVPMRLAHAVLPVMKSRRRGTIVNVSSLGAFQPVPSMAAYGATKSYVTSFSEALHEELRGSGVDVTVVCPGFIRTEFQERAGAGHVAVPGFLWMEADQVARETLAAAAKGEALVVPGWGYKVLAALSSTSPRDVTRRLLGVVARRT